MFDLNAQIPDGYVLIGYRPANFGEEYLIRGEAVSWPGSDPTLSEYLIIKKLRWEAREGEMYYFLNEHFEIEFAVQDEEGREMRGAWVSGNMFKSEEEAERVLRKIKEIVLDDNEICDAYYGEDDPRDTCDHCGADL